MFANPSASHADLLLPAATCWEREGLGSSLNPRADTATWAQLRQPVVKPLYESRSDVAIIFDLATRLASASISFTATSPPPSTTSCRRPV